MKVLLYLSMSGVEAMLPASVAAMSGVEGTWAPKVLRSNVGAIVG